MHKLWKVFSLAALLALGLTAMPLSAKVDPHFHITEPVWKTQKEGSAHLQGEEENVVTLKEGHYSRWIDRIEIPEYGRTFYNALVEASDGDRNKDWLMDLSQATEDGGFLYVPVTKIKATGKYTTPNVTDYDTPEQWEAKRQAALDQAVGLAQGAFSQELEKNKLITMHVFAAFLRDHPEVFWLDSGFALTTANQFGHLAGSEYILEAELILVLRADMYQFDIREKNYQDVEFLYGETDRMQQLVTGILSNAQGSAKEKVSYYNQYLACINEYNTDVSGGISDGTEACRSALTALEGKQGKEGPVCEGYAKALKVLCDASGIPCCLNDGLGGVGENKSNHMWNSVQIADAWYGVDVTWNDTDVEEPAFIEDYLLVGSNTIIHGEAFLDSHIVKNCVYEDCISFLNGPVLCSISLKEKEEGAIEEHEHNFISEITQEATCLNTGLATILCPECGVIQEENVEVPAKGHQMVTTKKVATLTQNGMKYSRCSLCGEMENYEGYSYPKNVVLSCKKYICNGKVLKPTVTVKGANNIAIPASNYTVTYSNSSSINPGNYTVTIKFKNNYSGSKTLTYSIAAKPTTLKKVTPGKKKLTISWTKVSAGITGYELQIATNAKFTSNKKIIKITNKATGSKTIKNLKGKKKYYVRIRSYYGSFYSSWSPVKTGKTKK